MKTTSIANWFGSNRSLASTVGVQLGKRSWAGVPFCGGCSELPYIKARSGIASDLHLHVLNLATIIHRPDSKASLVARLSSTLFHPHVLAGAQDRCRLRELAHGGGLFATEAPAHLGDEVSWAFDYFVCSWMTPGGRSGTKGEFNQKMSFRWNAKGGDSCTRFRSAAESLDGWLKALASWNFVVMDAFEFLGNCGDVLSHGIYADAPWPEDGDGYKHPFTESQQRRLARELGRFKKTRVVVRYGDHPLIRELYPKSAWTWIEQASKGQANNAVSEVLLINGPSYAEAA